MKLKIFGLLLVLFILVGCGIVQRQGSKLIQRTVDVDTAFNNYEWFYNTYQDIQASATKVKLAYDMYKDPTITGDAKLTYQTNYTGVVNYLQSLVADYNAKSKMWNRTLFKDKKLPYRIGIDITGGDVRISEIIGE